MTTRRILATSGGMVAGPVQMTWRVGKMVLDALALTKKDRPRVCLVETAGGEAGQIYRVELDGTNTTTVTIEGGALLGLALDRDGFLYVCDPSNHQVWRITAESTYEPFGGVIDYPNYAALGPDGRLFVSDSGSFDEATGQLFVIDADGATANVTPRPIAFANGLCVDATTLWVVESSAPGVSATALGGGPSNSSLPWSAASPTVWPLTRRRTPHLLLSTESTLALDERGRSSTALRRLDRRVRSLAHQRCLLRRNTGPVGIGVAVRRSHRHRSPAAARCRGVLPLPTK